MWVYAGANGGILRRLVFFTALQRKGSPCVTRVPGDPGSSLVCSLRRFSSTSCRLPRRNSLPIHTTRRTSSRATGSRAGSATASICCTTTSARQHRAGIAGVIAQACASRLASAESRFRLEPELFGAFRGADAGFLSDTITLACCVTLPTMALPPSPTDTFCTVMAGSPWLR